MIRNSLPYNAIAA